MRNAECGMRISELSTQYSARLSLSDLQYQFASTNPAQTPGDTSLFTKIPSSLASFAGPFGWLQSIVLAAPITQVVTLLP